MLEALRIIFTILGVTMVIWFFIIGWLIERDLWKE